MANEYLIEASIGADTSEFISELKKAQKTTQTFSKNLRFQIKSITSSIKDISMTGASISVLMNTVSSSIAKVTKTVKDLTETYKVQARAETQLETAVKNNPLLNKQSARELKNFASELQSVTAVGDETLLPMMGRLAGAGRNQNQIQKIMKVALDLSASGMMSLDSAVDALNGTLNGTTGTLGRQISAIKNLTDEELKSGKAIDIIAKNYAGVAENIAKTTESSTMLKNAFGDLKEYIGREFNNILAPIEISIARIIGKINDAISKRDTLKEALSSESYDDLLNVDKFWKSVYTNDREAKIAAKKVSDLFMAGLNSAMRESPEKFDEVFKKIAESAKISIPQLVILTEKYGLFNDEIRKQISNTYGSTESILENARVQEEVKKTEEERLKLQSEKELRDKRAQELITDNTKRLNAEKDMLQKTASVQNKTLNVQDLYNLELKYYLELITTDTTLVSENNTVAKERLQILRDLEKQIAENNTTETERELTQAELRNINIEILKREIETTENLTSAEMRFYETAGYSIEEMTKKQIARLKELNLQLLELEEQTELAKARSEEEKASIIEYYASKKYEIEKKYSEKTQKETSTGNKKNEKELSRHLNFNLSMIKNFTKKASSLIKGSFNIIFSIIKKTFSQIGQLFSIDIDGMLDSLLMWEDSILTFFIETLPQLPQFVQSALGSISSLLDSLFSDVNMNEILEIIKNISGIILDQMKKIINSIVTFLRSNKNIIEDVISTIIHGLIDFIMMILESDLLTNVIDIVGNVITDAIDYITNNAESIFGNIGKIIGKITEKLLDIIQSVIKSLPKIIPELLNIVFNLFEKVIDFISSNEFINNLSNVIITLVESAIEKGIPAIVNLLVKGSVQAIILAFNAPGIAVELVKSIITAFRDIDYNKIWSDIEQGFWTISKYFEKIGVWMLEGIGKGFKNINSFFKKIWQKIIDGIKNFFGIHSPSRVFQTIGEYMLDGLILGFQKVGQFFSKIWASVKNIFIDSFESFQVFGSYMWSGISSAFSNVGDFFSYVWNGISNAFSSVGETFSDFGSMMWNGISNAFSSVGDFFSSIVDKIKSFFSPLIDWLENLFNGFGDFMKSPFNAIIDMMNTVISALNSISIKIPNWVPGLGGKKFGIDIPKIQRLETGTNNALKGLTLVGESGPELIDMRGGERVYTADNTARIFEGSNSTSNNFNVTFNNIQDTSVYATIRQLKNYNREMAIRGIL